jgi:2,7-dihydroxy-5-methyl-1-naphthoate 7-O-methyltransferase
MTDSETPVNLWLLGDLQTPWCLRVAVTLEIAELLIEGPVAVDELAARRGCSAEALHRVLRHLSKKGVFAEPSFGVFAMNRASSELLEPHTKLYLGLEGIGGRFADVWSTLLPYVHTGRPAYRDLFGVDFWEDLTAHPHIGATFDAFMDHGHPNRDGGFPLVEGWERVGTVVDVGGGTGAMLAAILREHPHVRGVLVDLPATVARSDDVFEEAGVADRVTSVGQSFFDPLPPAGDLYVLSGIVNDWADEPAAAILRRCAEAARPDGSIAITGGFPEGDPPRNLDIEMLLVGGKDRSLEELRSLAATAGLDVVAVSEAVVECKPI